MQIVLEKAREVNTSKVTRVNLVVGELAGVVPDCVQFYFDIISKNTPAEGAVLDFRMKPTRLRCRKCGKEFTPSDQDWTCPDCRELSTEILAGRECFIESIEVE